MNSSKAILIGSGHVLGSSLSSLLSSLDKEISLSEKETYFPINNIRKLEYESEPVKPTCKKHHEYIKASTGWECRHCGRAL